MDVYRNVDADPEDVAEAHRKDQEVGSERGVDYRKYWIDEEEGAVFCLFEGPSKEAGAEVHRDAHGLAADEIYEVREHE